MEMVLAVIAGVIGVAGFVLACIVGKRSEDQNKEQLRQYEEQKRLNEEQSREQARQYEEQLKLSKEQLKFAEEQRKFAEEQQKFAEEQRKFAEEQVKLKERSDRLLFLSNVIFNDNIPRSSRQPFYDEYIALGGNGTVIQFWLREENSNSDKHS